MNQIPQIKGLSRGQRRSINAAIAGVSAFGQMRGGAAGIGFNSNRQGANVTIDRKRILSEVPQTFTRAVTGLLDGVQDNAYWVLIGNLACPTYTGNYTIYNTDATGNISLSPVNQPAYFVNLSELGSDNASLSVGNGTGNAAKPLNVVGNLIGGGNCAGSAFRPIVALTLSPPVLTLFPVTIGSVDGGANGNMTTAATYTYGNFTNAITGQTVKYGNGTIIGNQTPAWQRSIGNVTQATHGTAFFTGNGTFTLWQADEAAGSGNCTPSGS